MGKLRKGRILLRLLGGVGLGLGLAACQQPTAPTTGGVAVIDMDAVAAALGRDKVIAEQVQGYAREQESKLQELKAELEQQVSGATAELGADASQEDKQSVNAMAVEARNRLVREVSQARQSAQEMRARLVRDFAVEVQPVASRVAQERGFSIVMVKQPGLLAVASEVNITDAVIDELKSGATAAASTVTPPLPGAGGN